MSIPSLNKTGRSIVAMLTVAVVLVLLLVLAGILVRTYVARRIPDLTEAELSAARERWEQRGPDSYDMEIQIEGARPGTVVVEVRDRVVTAMSRDGHTPSQRRTWDVWSVPGQFETIEQELDLAEDPAGQMNAPAGTRLWLRCEFDPKYGYPRQYHRAVFGGGPEVYWKATRFVPR